MDSAIGKLNLGGSFPFAPSTPSIDLSQSGDFADAATGGERLNIRNVTQDLEMHHQPIQAGRGFREGLSPSDARSRVPVLCVPPEPAPADLNWSREREACAVGQTL